MTQPDYTHYVLIVDRSGSMVNIQEDAQGGINSFVDGVKDVPGKGTLTLYQFDTMHETVFDFTDIKDTPKYLLVPRYGTALLDACGFAVTQVGQKLAALPEDQRPSKVVVLITTDGEENSSQEWTNDAVKTLFTEQQEKYGWAFTYAGPDVNAFAVAGGMGIAAGSTLGYSTRSHVGTQSMYKSMTRTAVAFAAGGAADLTYTDQDREEAVQEDDEK